MTDYDDFEDDEDDIDLERFLDQQNEAFRADPSRTIFQQALAELREGRKRSHWMWFVFPQADGVSDHYGRKPSEMTVWFGLAGVPEATAYYQHPVLGGRLLECFKAVMAAPTRDPAEIFGPVDAGKLCACATLFEKVEGSDPIFGETLDAFFSGARCEATDAIAARAAAEG